MPSFDSHDMLVPIYQHVAAIASRPLRMGRGAGRQKEADRLWNVVLVLQTEARLLLEEALCGCREAAGRCSI